MNRILPSHNRSATGGRRLHRPRALIGALLVLCLLLAQWVGLSHAIAHAHGLGNASLHQALADRGADGNPTGNGLFDHPRASGACAALDAATLGAGPCTDIAMLPVQRAAQVPAVALPLQRWHSPFIANFSTRAPPRIDA